MGTEVLHLLKITAVLQRRALWDCCKISPTFLYYLHI